MSAFKLGFRNRSVDEKLIICDRKIKAVADGPANHYDAPKLADAQAVVAEARASRERLGSLEAETRAERSRYQALVQTACGKVTRLYHNVASKVDLKPEKMRASGLELPAPKRPLGVAAAPGNLRAEDHEMEGVVRLRWERPQRRCTFLVEFTSDESAKSGWTQCEVCSRQSCLVKNLKPGAKYWFRVRAVNSHGTSPWSDPACVRVT